MILKGNYLKSYKAIAFKDNYISLSYHLPYCVGTFQIDERLVIGVDANHGQASGGAHTPSYQNPEQQFEMLPIAYLFIFYRKV